MKAKCSKCGKGIEDGNVCMSLVDKSDLCSDCATVEALKFRSDKVPEDTLQKMKNS